MALGSGGDGRKSIFLAFSLRLWRVADLARRPAVAVAAGAQTQFRPASLFFTLERDSLDSNFRAWL